VHKTSVFKVKIDLKKSVGSYLYDANRDKLFLDFFGMYSALPLGYDHKIFHSKDYQDEVLEASTVKVTNCEFESDFGNEFYRSFSGHPSMQPYQHFHFSCTGALAIEAAIKVAYAYRKPKIKPKIIAFTNSFHGINSYGSLITDRFGSVAQRLTGYPESEQVLRFSSPVIGGVVESQAVLEKMTQTISSDVGRSIFCILVEPILCTAGDLILDPKFLMGLRDLATKYDIPLIFDEVQTGFGTTGSMWYFENIGFEPDIVTFGKKVQVSGMMVKEKFSSLFKTPLHLEVTWDGDLLDMIRSKYILKAYDEYKIIENVRVQGKKIADSLRAMSIFSEVRQIGLLLAMDFDNQAQRDRFSGELFNQGMLVNTTQTKTIRFRPHLAVDNEAIDDAIKRIRRAAEICF
jgi:L-lysine 6-transaminase